MMSEERLTVQDGLGFVGEEGDVATGGLASIRRGVVGNLLEGGDDLAILFNEDSVFYERCQPPHMPYTNAVSYPKCWEPIHKPVSHYVNAQVKPYIPQRSS